MYVNFNRCCIKKVTVKINEKQQKNPAIEKENKASNMIKMMKSKWKREKHEFDEKLVEGDETKEKPLKWRKTDGPTTDRPTD